MSRSCSQVCRDFSVTPWTPLLPKRLSVCLSVLDGATSHLTAYPCKSTSPSEVITKLHEWMDTLSDEPEGDLCGYGLPPTS